jgi:aminoglycoside phosphotransferase (APT) family kinase protein
LKRPESFERDPSIDFIGCLRIVGKAYAAGADEWYEDGVSAERIDGGANNALYRIEVDGRRYACKLCVTDERHRARREYDALCALQNAGLDVAPRPVGLDESCRAIPFPVVIYRWTNGRALCPPLSPQHLRDLLDSVQSIHSLRPDSSTAGIRDAWFHWFDVGQYLSELYLFLKDYGSWIATADPDGATLRQRLAAVVNHTAQAVRSADIDARRESIPICLCHVDPNLTNTVLGPDGKLRWLDWEYSGWGDPALDLAELRWHASLEALTASEKSWLRDHYRRPDGDAGFESRLHVWDLILSTRWPFLILRVFRSQFLGPDRVRLSQPQEDPQELRARLIRSIERAEGFVFAGRST